MIPSFQAYRRQPIACRRIGDVEDRQAGRQRPGASRRSARAIAIWTAPAITVTRRKWARASAAAMAAGLCRREDLWVTSKLWNNYHAPQHVRPAVERSLRDLGLDYLDLYLIHFPIALEFVPFDERYPPGWLADPKRPQLGMQPAQVPLAETWRAMESLVDAGLVRNVGICNFGCALIRDLLAQARIRPTVLQVELHPFLAQRNC